MSAVIKKNSTDAAAISGSMIVERTNKAKTVAGTTNVTATAFLM